MVTRSALALAALLPLVLSGCPEPCLDPTAPGCAPSDDDDLTAGNDDDATGDDDSADDDDTTGSGDDDDTTGSDDDDSTPPPGPLAVDPPPAPVFPEMVATVSITLVTADAAYAGTDENSLSLCLTATDCYSLDTIDVNDFERAATDVHHREGLVLPRSAIDRVELRSVNGVDRYEPGCLAIQLDGEPVYCSTLSGLFFGEEDNELQTWSDPQGLHLDCASCFPEVLTHGPMLGAPEPAAARVWGRTDATRLLGLRVGSREDLTDSVVVDWAWPSPSTDYAATLTVGNLPPDSTWYAALEVDGVVFGPPSLVRTAPTPGTSGPLRFAFGSCSKLDDQPLFADVAATDPDLFLFVGDNHYGNTADVDGLRWNYRWSLERPERGALAGAVPTLATWDDHDYTGNNTDATAPGRDSAVRVFSEYWANPSAGTPQIPGVFFPFTYGDVDFFFLDDRYHRGLDDSILGAAQQQWLIDALLASTAAFKVVISGSQWTADGSGDSWAAFVTQRDVIFDAIRDGDVSGVVLLSGDVHRGEFRVIDRASAGGYDLPELTSSPLANVNSSCPDEAEILECIDDQVLFVQVDVDTLLPDPTLEATMIGLGGAVLATYETTLSELTGP